jgi:hypothetical protein
MRMISWVKEKLWLRVEVGSMLKGSESHPNVPDVDSSAVIHVYKGEM